MSVFDTGREAHDDADAQSETNAHPVEADHYDLEYEETLAQSRDTKKEVIRDWMRGIYPSNSQSSRDAGTIYNSVLDARNFDDGTGIVLHGRAIEAVRTQSGRIFRNIGCSHNSGRGLWNGNCRASAVRHARHQPAVPDEVGDAVTSTDLRFMLDVLLEATSARSRRRLEEGRRLRDIVDYQVDGSGELFTFADGTQVFTGRDSTAHGSGDFGFVIPDGEIARSPDDAELLLTPQLVRHARAEGIDVDRQGEWFFVDASDLIDEFDGSIQKPGLGSKPYGPSPMDNHVARDWKPYVRDDVFVTRFNELVEYTEGQVLPQTVAECLEMFRTNDYHYRTSISADDLYEMAGYVAVRGSVRHRDNDHYQEHFDDWRVAVAHDLTVYTGDDFGVTMD
jgi:hypothetical protein